MARIRSIKPEFWSDHRMAEELGRDQRLFYIGLWNEADDEGRFLAHPRRLLGVIFPYDRDLTEQFIEDSLRTLADTDRLVRYSVDGEPYGQLTKFAEHQRINRPTPSKLPSPPTSSGGSMSPHGGLSEASIPGAHTWEQGTGNREHDELPSTTSREELASMVIRTANEGMAANAELRDVFRPIDPMHGSRSSVIEWLEGGVPAELAASVVRSVAETYRPSRRHRQISTMAYFTSAVLEEHERSNARESTNGKQRTRTARRGRGPAKVAGKAAAKQADRRGEGHSDD